MNSRLVLTAFTATTATLLYNNVVYINKDSLGIQYGSLTNEFSKSPLQPGYHFRKPFDEVIITSMKPKKTKIVRMYTGTKDLQLIEISIEIISRPNPDREREGNGEEEEEEGKGKRENSSRKRRRSSRRGCR